MRSSLQSGAAYNYPPAASEWIPGGDAGVSATIAKMRNLVHGPQGVRSFLVKQYAYDAVRGVERGQTEIDAVFDRVMQDIEFRGEHGETLQSPEATIRLGAGDCDDHSSLLAALYQSLGFETRFKTVALLHSPDEYSHVYVEVNNKGHWLPADSTIQASYPGWEPDNVARSESYGSNGVSLLGLGLLALGCLL